MTPLDPSSPPATGDVVDPARLEQLLDGLPMDGTDTVIDAETEQVSLDEVLRRVSALADVLRAAGVRPGHAVGNLVQPGPAGIVAMFAVWAAGGAYVPINRRYTGTEVSALIGETPVALVIGSGADLDAHEPPTGALVYDASTGSAAVRRAVPPDPLRYPADIGLVLRTSGTTGRPKAVLLRHSGTLAALDASLAKLRPAPRLTPPRPRHRLNLIPVSLALWAGIFNTLFSFRAGFGVVLLDEFTPSGFMRAVREHNVRSTVLAPAMIAMLTDDPDVDHLAPLRLVRSITAPLSPELARRFHDRYGVFVLNSYGQTELGGEVVGWTTADLRHFGEAKLGAAGRPYDHVDLRIRRDDGVDARADELGEIVVRSPYRMTGYSTSDGVVVSSAEDRFVDGYLRTGDIGRLDGDGFLWVEGRVSDMINRGGLKVFPDEVEEVLRRHPSVRDAGVAALPDPRLGEVPHAWVIADEPIDPAALATWCRTRLAPYKVPVGFTQLSELPRSDIGKLLRRRLPDQAR